MKNKKIILMLIILLIVAFIIVIYVRNQRKFYHTPIVSLIRTSEDKVIVTAGIYRYGDITLDGELSSYDIKYMELLLNSNIKFLEEQKTIADFDQNGVVDNKDLQAVRKYLKNDRVVKYNVRNQKLLYCAIKIDHFGGCNWQKDNTFKLDENIEYYIYAKDNENVSKSYDFIYNISEIYEETDSLDDDLVE